MVLRIPSHFLNFIHAPLNLMARLCIIDTPVGCSEVEPKIGKQQALSPFSKVIFE
jgi:hypothetical protein